MNALFHHDTVVAVLGSGSRGNCTYIGDGRRGVLVDCGLSTRQITRRMADVGLEGAPIDAVFVTHEHADHVAAAGVLDRALFKRTGARVPFYMTHGTARGLNPKVRPTRIEELRAGSTVALGPLRISAHAVPHDTREPVGFAVQTPGARVGVITDLGRSTRLVEQVLSTLDVAVLEFNHDPQMLRDGPYPWQLKQRIRSPHGHLSNEQAAGLLTRGVSERLRHVVLPQLAPFFAATGATSSSVVTILAWWSWWLWDWMSVLSLLSCSRNARTRSFWYSFSTPGVK